MPATRTIYPAAGAVPAADPAHNEPMTDGEAATSGDRTTANDGRVAAVVVRRVRPGREADFEEWLHGLIEVALGFAGHQGVSVIRPEPGGPGDYVIVFSFDSDEHLAAWMDSPERAALVAKVEPMMRDEVAESRLTGMETWFRVPGGRVVRPPARWKMWVVSAVAVCLLTLGLTEAVGSTLASIVLPLRLAISALVVTGLMTWLVMPAASRVLARWLYPQA